MSQPLIALTFDDGPNTVITPQVLDTLEESVKPVLKDRNIELIYKPLVPP